MSEPYEPGPEVLTEARAYALIEAAYGLIKLALVHDMCPIDWDMDARRWIDKYKLMSPLNQREQR